MTVSIPIEYRFDAWRVAARSALQQGLAPEEVIWLDVSQEQGLFQEAALEYRVEKAALKVPGAFLKLAESAAAHRDPQRWAVLYRLLWRVTRGGERDLLHLAMDEDVHRVQMWAKAVHRDVHKMHAFVRFRQVSSEAGSEAFVAWFEPDHLIVRLAAPFFRKRFAGMEWSILTPDECVHWDGKQMTYSESLTRESAPSGDELDGLWRTYYRSIFNPARLKLQAMRSEMPKKFWKNLPEAADIHALSVGSSERTEAMLGRVPLAPKAAPANAYLERVRNLGRKDELE